MNSRSDKTPGEQPKGKGGVRHNPWMSKPSQPAQSKESVPAQGFQKLTVQPQLEACMYKMRQEMWEEIRVLRTFLARELQIAQQEGTRHSF